MYILTKVSEDGVESKVTLTSDEVDAIYSAMGDYQDYGDTEEELADSIRDKIMDLG